MTSIRRSTWMPRLLTAAAGTALALSLAACGGSGGDKPADDQKSEAAQSTEDESSSGGGFGGGAATTPAASEPAESEPTDTKSTDPYADAAKTTNWASDDGMKIDKKGNGTVPASSIEADLVDLFENKLEMKVKKAECAGDMELQEWYGFKTCNVTVEDKDRTKGEWTYYGTVKIVDHKEKMVKYELKFPGIDKEDFDFKD
ncbi:hypothetical protein [Brevibacterium spongiae]|uniref:Lipoprotein n=1 Tax=Brevibacterium spongiae TaxID=2909672 RepID=A0ABY5SRN3_9MICO|nr:hypothetical protein [Brevibacterium spongiae]UVI37162.1 hypothetical protein L1F31_05785 [Brevibacterium spongiae]